MHSFIEDIRYAARTLRKDSVFAVVAVLTLALGMGANTVVLSILNALYLRTAPVRSANELVVSVGRHRGVALPEYQYYREHNTVFSGVAAEYPTAHVYLETGDDSKIVLSAIVSENYFDLLGVRPYLGRFFVASEEQSQGIKVAVLSYGLWKGKFASDRDIVGETVKLNGVTAIIIGVAPPEFHRLFSGIDDDLYLPSGAAAGIVPHCNPAGYKCDFFESIIGRLKPGKDISTAQTELNGLDQQWEKIYPDLEKNTLKLYEARGIDPHNRLDIGHLPSTLTVVVVLLLLIACANVSGLLLARGTVRRKEIAMRLALGAGPVRIMRQLLTEAALLAALGSALGMTLLLWASRWLSNFPFVNTEGFRSFYNIGLDWHVGVATFLLSIVTVFVFGTIPAFRATKFALLESLNQTATRGTERSRARTILVAGQVALAVVLSAGAVLVVRSLNHVLMGPGFDPSHLAIVRVSPFRLGYAPAKSAAVQNEALRRIAALPGVEAVSFGQLMPWWESWDETVALPGQNDVPSDAQMRVHYNSIAPNYLQTLNISMRQGREFTEADRSGTPNVVVVNQSLARQMWPRSDAIGQVLVIGGTPCTVVGVAQDAQYSSSASSAHPFFYRPYWQIQNNGDSRFIVRTASQPGAMLHDIKSVIRGVDSNVPIGEDATMTGALINDFGSLRLTRVVLIFAGTAAVVLSAIGLYSVIAFLVARRTREIGIRVALGATRQQVLSLFLGQGMKLVLGGAIAGVVIAVVGLRILATLLYEISAADPLTLAAVSLLLALVCLLASYIPARRASAVDPMVALRDE